MMIQGTLLIALSPQVRFKLMWTDQEMGIANPRHSQNERPVAIHRAVQIQISWNIEAN
jgi:hypothetical protein